MEYDVFISYASEDRVFVEQLVVILQKASLKVWCDSLQLKLGDDIAEEINKGLLKSRYGVVILSKIFLEKKRWTKAELNALINRQVNSGQKIILPVWHNISVEEVSEYSSILAGKVAVRSSDGLDIVAKQIVAVCMEPINTNSVAIFQTESGSVGVKEKCFEIIRNDNIVEWRKLVRAGIETIPDKLVKWKQDTGDAAAHQGGQVWHDALFEGIKIGIPGLIPLFAAVESGNLKYWSEAMLFARRLSMMRSKMGGGAVWALRIPQYMLYVMGSLGMSIAAGLKLLDVIEQWLSLRMQSDYDRQEAAWIEQIEAVRSPNGIQVAANNPFAFLLQFAEIEELKGFFGNQNRTRQNLFAANLTASLIELRLCLQNDNRRNDLQRSGDYFFYVQPLWCLLTPEMFQEIAVDMFDDSEGIRSLIFPQQSALSGHMWDYWKLWKQKCIAAWNSNISVRFHGRFLLLPGEPEDKS